MRDAYGLLPHVMSVFIQPSHAQASTRLAARKLTSLTFECLTPTLASAIAPLYRFDMEA